MKGTKTANLPGSFPRGSRRLAAWSVLACWLLVGGALGAASAAPGVSSEPDSGGSRVWFTGLSASLADWLFWWIQNVNWHAPSTWGYTALIVGSFLWVTRAPELRIHRVRLGVALVMLVCFWMATRTRNPMYMLFGLLLLRPVLFIFGVLWSDVITHYASKSFEAVVYGGDSGKPVRQISYALPRHFRDTKRPRLAIQFIKHQLREKPEDFEGLLLLARIYAEDRRDLAAAAKVVKRALKAETIPPSHKNFLAVEYEFWRQHLDPSAQPLLADERLWKEIRAHSRFTEARRHLAEGRVKEAIASTEAELRRSPEDVEGLYLLARIHGEYTRDLKAAERWAQKIIDLKYTPSGYSEFVKAMLETWRGVADTPRPDFSFKPVLADEAVTPSYQSARRLCEDGRFGTAIQHTERALQNGNPDDFEGLFLLASIQAEKCRNVKAAGKVVERIQSIPGIAEEDKARSVAKLKEWKAETMTLPGSFY